ncbi:MAG: hypothetical protein AAF456_23900 [Planctomycetota bacterium]
MKLKTGRWVAFAAVLLLTASPGCSTFGPMSADRELPAGNMSVGAENGGYTVYLSGARNMDPYHGVISTDMENPTTVQMALHASGAIDKFNAMTVNVVRTVAETGQQLRMPVDYVSREKAVRMEQDYTLHPGDVISVKMKASGAMDEVLDSLGITPNGF